MESWKGHSNSLILIDHARVWSRRIDGKDKVPMEGMMLPDSGGDGPNLLDLIALEETLDKLEEMDPLTAQIADLKLPVLLPIFFALILFEYLLVWGNIF